MGSTAINPPINKNRLRPTWSFFLLGSQLTSFMFIFMRFSLEC